MEETKIIYYMDDDKMPYLIKLNMAPERAKLKDFKQSLNTNSRNFKYFFQTIVDDFGVVKEEIMDDEAKLPCVNGRVVAWLIQVEGSLTGSDNRSTNSFNLNDFNSNNNNNNNQQLQQQQQQDDAQMRQSTQSIASTVSSNNENYELSNRKSSNRNSQNQIYDTLNSRKNSLPMKQSAPNPQRQMVTPLK